MDTEPPTIGDQEMEILRYVAENAPVTAREAADRFAESHGLARTTVLTVIERLRAKGYVTRRKGAGAYEYSATIGAADLLKNLVGRFVDRTLGGSIAPFVAYLTDARGLKPEEVEELRRIARDLDAR